MKKKKDIVLCDICNRYESEMIVETSEKGKVVAIEEMCISCFEDLAKEEEEKAKDFEEYSNNR